MKSFIFTYCCKTSEQPEQIFSQGYILPSVSKDSDDRNSGKNPAGLTREQRRLMLGITEPSYYGR